MKGMTLIFENGKPMVNLTLRSQSAASAATVVCDSLNPKMSDATRRLLNSMRSRLTVTLEVARLLEPGKTDEQICREQFKTGKYAGLFLTVEQEQGMLK